METSSDWLLTTLAAGTTACLREIQQHDRDNSKSFDIGEVLYLLPSRQITQVGTDLQVILKGPVEELLQAANDDDQHLDEPNAANASAAEAISIASEMIWMYTENRKEPPAEAVRAVIFEFHRVLLALGASHNKTQNRIAKICEWLWRVEDPQREQIAPRTLLYLLMRSFGGETALAAQEGRRTTRGGSATDVKRVYAMRQALELLELSDEFEQSQSVRTFLLRCASCAAYLRESQGRKFLAYLLTLEDIRDVVLDTLLSQLGTVRKERAGWYGAVFMAAWKLEASEWMFKALMRVAEHAIYSGSEPYATNLRTVLSSFHLSKGSAAVDKMLNRIYAPVLFKNLMIANARVRRNAVTVLADAFPVHDPSARLQDIEEAITFQCGKMIELLDDPAAIVRKAAVEGTARVLCLLWEIVPIGQAKKIIDIMTSKLAFDASSPQVRIAVFEGLEFMLKNHLIYPVLSVALKRVRALVHDNVEKVRLSFLNLLIALKAKRIRTLRYFDVVPLEELLCRLPQESPGVATKIMKLMVSSYFPLEKKGKSAEEVASSQVRACLSMLLKSKYSCGYFYRNVNLYVPPGPLCEFALRLCDRALESPEADCENAPQQARIKQKRPSKSKRTRSTVDKENDHPSNNPTSTIEPERNCRISATRSDLLSIAADVLESVHPSLSKDSNREVRKSVEDIFGGSGLKEFLTGEGNTAKSRAACWRIAGCISFERMRPIHELWQEQMICIPQTARNSDLARSSYEEMLSALLICGIRWNRWSHIVSLVSGWADGAAHGQRAPSVRAKKGKGRPRSSGRRSDSISSELSSGQSDMLFALRTLAAVLLKDSKVQETFRDALLTAPLHVSREESAEHNPAVLLQAIRVGCSRALDFALENHAGVSSLDKSAAFALLDGLSMSWKTLLFYASEVEGSSLLVAELQSMVQWSNGDALFENANNLDPNFGVALVNTTLTYLADSTALGYLDVSDLSAVEGVCKQIVASIDLTDHPILLRPVSEMLRMCFQLFETHSYSSDRNIEEMAVPTALLTTAKSVCSISCKIMNSCEVLEDQITGLPGKLNVVGSFFSDFLLAVCSSDSPNVFEEVLGESLRLCFENKTSAEKSFMASTWCGCVVHMVIASSRKVFMADKVFSNIMTWFFETGEYHTSSRASANFICFMMNSILSIFEEDKVPSTEARQFMAVVEITVNERFRTKEQEHDEEVQTRLSEIEETLDQLKQLCRTAEGNAVTNQQQGNHLAAAKDAS